MKPNLASNGAKVHRNFSEIVLYYGKTNKEKRKENIYEALFKGGYLYIEETIEKLKLKINGRRVKSVLEKTKVLKWDRISKEQIRRKMGIKQILFLDTEMKQLN